MISPRSSLALQKTNKPLIIEFMKNAFRLIVYYFFVVVSCVCIFSVAYLSYFYASAFLSGARSSFSVAVLLSALFTAAIFVFLFAPLFLILFIARQKRKTASVLCYAFLSLLSFFLFLPLSIRAYKNFDFQSFQTVKNKKNSGSFFEKKDGAMYFFLKGEDGKLGKLKIFDCEAEEADRDESSHLFEAFHNLKALLINRYFRDIPFTVAFALAMAFAILPLFIGEWQLLNAFYCVVLYSLFIYANAFFSSPLFSVARNVIHSLLSLLHLDGEYSLFLMNGVFLFLLLVLFIVGLFKNLRRRA